MKINDASRHAALPLLSFNSFLIQEHLRSDEARDVFQQGFEEKVSKLEAGVRSLTERRSSLADTDHPLSKGALLLQPPTLPVMSISCLIKYYLVINLHNVDKVNHDYC